MAKELERHGHRAGSMGYFAALASRGLLQYIMRPLHSIAFEQCIRDTASAAERALGAVLEDLQRYAPMLMFMPPDDLHRLSRAINQLGSMCALAGAQLPGATQCQYYLTLGHQDTQPTSRASLRDLEDAFGILAGNGSYYLSAGRHSILEEALGGDLPLDDETLRFLLALQGSNGPQQLEDLWRMWQYRSAPDKYRGRCGYAIGTERYIEALEGEIFGSRFSGRALSQGDYSYGDSLASDLQGYALQLCEDTSLTPTDEYMTYESRRQMLDAAEQLARVTYFDRGRLEAQLERLRRLEGFDNQIIEFDTSGEVRAKMCWDNGRNVMYIEADVCFKQYALNGDVPMPMPPPPMIPAGSSFNYEAYQEKKRLYDEDQSREFERRVTHAIFNFEQWGGNYQVFGNQALEVNVKINRVYSSRKAAVVRIAELGSPRSFAWGGTFPNIFDWAPEKNKSMGLLDDFTDKATAVHEFGHWLGLQDAYAIDNRQWIPLEIAAAIATGGVSKEKGRHMVNYLLEKGGSQDFKANGAILGPYPLYGVPEGVYPDYDEHTVMNITGGNKLTGKDPRVTNNDMEMVVLAFQTGQRQNYQVQFPWEIISQAMGRGN